MIANIFVIVFDAAKFLLVLEAEKNAHTYNINVNTMMPGDAGCMHNHRAHSGS